MSKQDQKNNQHDQQVDAMEMPLLSHLIELRTRLLHTLLATILLFVPLYWYANELYLFVADPLLAYLPVDSSMIATEVASPFLTPFKLAAVLAFFAAAPLILYQLWRFVSPGLYKKEKFFVLPMMLASVLLFYGGIAFSYYAVMPLIFQFTTSVAPEGVTVMTDISRYLDFILKLFFAFGVAFQMPVAVMLLIKSGVASVQGLRQKRPYVVVGCFAFGMLLTPPDVVSQVLLAVPMWLLYEVGMVLGTLVTTTADDDDR